MQNIVYEAKIVYKDNEPVSAQFGLENTFEPYEYDGKICYRSQYNPLLTKDNINSKNLLIMEIDEYIAAHITKSKLNADVVNEIGKEYFIEKLNTRNSNIVGYYEKEYIWTSIISTTVKTQVILDSNLYSKFESTEFGWAKYKNKDKIAIWLRDYDYDFNKPNDYNMNAGHTEIMSVYERTANNEVIYYFLDTDRYKINFCFLINGIVYKSCIVSEYKFNKIASGIGSKTYTQLDENNLSRIHSQKKIYATCDVERTNIMKLVRENIMKLERKHKAILQKFLYGR